MIYSMRETDRFLIGPVGLTFIKLEKPNDTGGN